MNTCFNPPRRRLLQWLGAGALIGRAGATLALPGSTNAQFEQSFGDAFLDQYWQRNTDGAVMVGYYQVAGVLLVPDAAFRADYQVFLDAALAQLAGMDVATLDDRYRTDWAVLDNELRYERWQLTTLREWQWNPAFYNVAEPFAVIASGSYAPLEERLRSILSRLQRVPEYYAAAKQSIQQPTREHTALAIAQNQGALEVFGDDLQRQVDASGLSADEKTLFGRRRVAAREAIGDYLKWLQALDATNGAARSFRLGAALYQQKFAFVQQSGEEAPALYQRAQRERQEVLAQMEQLTTQLWPRYFADSAPPADRLDKIGRMIDKLSQNHVAPQDYVASIERLIPQLTQWVSDHHLIDIDPSKPLKVRLTPTYERGVAIAGIEAPGPYDPSAPTYFNVDPIDTESPQQAESFLREYNNWMLPVFITHEAIPGHYVQLMYANRSPSRIKSLFGNGAMIEGWAVYSERMMLESGYGNNAPEQWLIYWKWYLRSVTNTVLDYGVHVLGLSEQDAKTMLVREAFQSEKEASNKWLRVQRSSVQLTQYFAGFSAIYRLRERVRSQQGAAFELQRFHEKFLSYGSAPVAVIAQLMLPATRGK